MNSENEFTFGELKWSHSKKSVVFRDRQGAGYIVHLFPIAIAGACFAEMILSPRETGVTTLSLFPTLYRLKAEHPLFLKSTKLSFFRTPLLVFVPKQKVYLRDPT
jgi:hypothetical protein